MQRIIKYPDLFFRVGSTIALTVGFFIPIIGILISASLIIYKINNKLVIAKEEWLFTLATLILLTAYFGITIYLATPISGTPENSEFIRYLIF